MFFPFSSPPRKKSSALQKQSAQAVEKAFGSFDSLN